MKPLPINFGGACVLLFVSFLIVMFGIKEWKERYAVDCDSNPAADGCICDGWNEEIIGFDSRLQSDRYNANSINESELNNLINTKCDSLYYGISFEESYYWLDYKDSYIINLLLVKGGILEQIECRYKILDPVTIKHCTKSHPPNECEKDNPKFILTHQDNNTDYCKRKDINDESCETIGTAILKNYGYCIEDNKFVIKPQSCSNMRMIRTDELVDIFKEICST